MFRGVGLQLSQLEEPTSERAISLLGVFQHLKGVVGGGDVKGGGRARTCNRNQSQYVVSIRPIHAMGNCKRATYQYRFFEKLAGRMQGSLFSRQVILCMVRACLCFVGPFSGRRFAGEDTREPTPDQNTEQNTTTKKNIGSKKVVQPPKKT